MGAWDDFADRLVIGPRSGVQEVMQGEYALQRERAKRRDEESDKWLDLSYLSPADRQAQYGTTSPRILRAEAPTRANVYGGIAAAARTASERAAREQAEREALAAELMRVKRSQLPTPEHQGPSIPLERILAHPKGEDLYKHLTPVPKAPAKDPGFTLGAGQTRFDAQGQPLAALPDKPSKPWYENRQLTELLGEKQDLLAKPVRTKEEATRLMQIEGVLKEYQTVQGGIAGQKERDVFAERQLHPIAEKASQYVDPNNYSTPTPDTTKAEVEKKYRHIPNASNPGRGVLTVWQLINKAAQIVTRRADLFYPFTGNTAKDAGNRALATARWHAAALAGDPDVNELKALEAAIPQMVRSFGDTGNIAFAERQMTTEAAGLASANSADAAIRRLGTLLDLTNTGMGFYGLNPLKVPAIEKFKGFKTKGDKPTEEVGVPR